jgi:RimJ/RimL family protein N-acetyltransferase
VRTGTIDDIEAMVDLYVRVGEEGLFVAAASPIDRHERRLWLQHRIAAPWTLVVVATNVNEPIGYLTAVGSESHPAAIGLGVAREWRNRGVGTNLARATIHWGNTHNVHKFTAEVFPHNEPTVHLFEKLGFRREGVLRRHYRRRSGALGRHLLGLLLEHRSNAAPPGGRD